MFIVSDDDQDASYHPEDEKKSKGKKIDEGASSKSRKRKEPVKLLPFEVPAPEEASPICVVHQDTRVCSMVPVAIVETRGSGDNTKIMKHRCGINSFVCTIAARAIIDRSSDQKYTCVFCHQDDDDHVFCAGEDQQMAATLQLLPYPCPYDCGHHFLLKNLEAHKRQCERAPCPNSWVFEDQCVGCEHPNREEHGCEYKVAKKANGSVDTDALMRILKKISTKIGFGPGQAQLIFSVIGPQLARQ
eukprot:jgi/Mesvir1/14795/Mv05435-RA.1